MTLELNPNQQTQVRRPKWKRFDLKYAQTIAKKRVKIFDVFDMDFEVEFINSSGGKIIVKFEGNVSFYTFFYYYYFLGKVPHLWGNEETMSFLIQQVEWRSSRVMRAKL